MEDASRKEQQPLVNMKPDLRAVFNWLREKHVKRIIRVAVLDYGDRGHAESAIGECLRGFDVEYLDWIKLDVSSEVVCQSTKIVKEVSLYWSGNYSVLMGWMSAEGFANRSKFPEVGSQPPLALQVSLCSKLAETHKSHRERGTYVH